MAWISCCHPYWFLIALLMVFSPLSISFAEICQTQIKSCTRLEVFIDEFGFSKTFGRLELNVSDIYFSNPNPPYNLSTTCFLLATYKSYPKPEDCAFLHSDRFMILYTFDRLQGNDSFHLAYSDFDYSEEYSLHFLSNYALNISMDVRYAMYNLIHDRNGNRTRRSYLSGTKAYHPFIHAVLFLIYLISSCFSISLLLLFNNHAPRPIHKFMLLVLLLKTSGLLLELVQEIYITRTGCLQCWPTPFLTFISAFFTKVPLVTLLQLISSGWSFLKPFLSRKDKVLLLSTIFLELLMCVMNVHVERTRTYLDESAYLGLMNTRPVVYGYQLIALVLALLSSIRFLRQAVQAHGKASEASMKVSLLTLFLIIVVIYYYSKIFFPVLMASLASTYQYLWLVLLLEELWNLVLYAFIAYKFRPQALKFNFRYNDDVEKVIALAYNDEVHEAVSIASDSTKRTLGLLFIFEALFLRFME